MHLLKYETKHTWSKWQVRQYTIKKESLHNEALIFSKTRTALKSSLTWDFCFKCQRKMTKNFVQVSFAHFRDCRLGIFDSEKKNCVGLVCCIRMTHVRRNTPLWCFSEKNDQWTNSKAQAHISIFSWNHLETSFLIFRFMSVWNTIFGQNETFFKHREFNELGHLVSKSTQSNRLQQSKKLSNSYVRSSSARQTQSYTYSVYTFFPTPPSRIYSYMCVEVLNLASVSFPS